MDLIRRLKTNEKDHSGLLMKMVRDDCEAIGDRSSKLRKAHGKF